MLYSHRKSLQSCWPAARGQLTAHTTRGGPTVPEVAGTTRGHAMNGLALGSAIPDADGDDAARQYNGRPIGPTASRA